MGGFHVSRNNQKRDRHVSEMKPTQASTVQWVYNLDNVYFRAMMMTACDLSAITKPWEVQSKVRVMTIKGLNKEGSRLLADNELSV